MYTGEAAGFAAAQAVMEKTTPRQNRYRAAVAGPGGTGIPRDILQRCQNCRPRELDPRRAVFRHQGPLHDLRRPSRPAPVRHPGKALASCLRIGRWWLDPMTVAKSTRSNGWRMTGSLSPISPPCYVASSRLSTSRRDSVAATLKTMELKPPALISLVRGLRAHVPVAASAAEPHPDRWA